MALSMDLRVEGEDWQKISDLEDLCQRALEAGLAEASFKADVNIDVLLTDDDALQALNSQWRGKPKPTDVLSFPAGDNPEGFLGDIAIAFGVAAGDAEASKKALSNHLCHLLIHGLLHLLGHDHIKEDEAEHMEALERAALAKLGIGDPYSRIAPN